MSVLAHYVKWRLGLAPAEGATTAAEADCLVRHARGKQRLAEIGVWQGGTTARLRAAMAPNATLFAVDPFPKGRLGFSTQRAIATREVARVANGQVVWIRHTAADASRDPVVGRGGFEFVFLDALHTYEGLREDWDAWSPLVAGGGVIAIHDSRASPGGHSEDVGGVRFTNDVILKDARFEVLEAVDSLTVMRRRHRVDRDRDTEER
jgi:predicted O-methyltransferase YrrM